jgi:hypothetical protein
LKAKIKNVHEDHVIVEEVESLNRPTKIEKDFSCCYFDIQDLAKDLGLSLTELFSIMGRVMVKMPDNNALDIGLNLIHRKENLIVPGMLRCNFGSNKVNL